MGNGFGWLNLILTLVGQAAIIEKAGGNGWVVFIPFYGSYRFFRIAGRKNLFWWYLALTIGLFMCIFAIILSNGRLDVDNYIIIMIFLSVGFFIIHILRCLGLADAFVLGGGYVLGLIILPVVFYLILGFSGSMRYYGSERNGETDYPEQNESGYGEQKDYSGQYNDKKDFYDRDF
ncbi:MAG: hypothetical protein BWY61_01745 [Firmicutes bacterium ADurb.Bin354]|nr:MAG: hypothetical protein BWY61_01745 [Firmicutes bacterium ADurb.Bin354]